MSKWIEENNNHILEGHGDKFVVCHVLYSKQLPPKWEIKQSPFLLDVNKRFETLDKAKTYCEDRYKELNGQRDEITRLRAELAAANTRMSKLDFERTAAELERDALRAENKRLREALKPFIVVLFNAEVEDLSPGQIYGWGFEKEHLRRARAALEGVTEKEGAGNE